MLDEKFNDLKPDFILRVQDKHLEKKTLAEESLGYFIKFTPHVVRQTLSQQQQQKVPNFSPGHTNLLIGSAERKVLV